MLVVGWGGLGHGVHIAIIRRLGVGGEGEGGESMRPLKLSKPPHDYAAVDLVLDKLDKLLARFEAHAKAATGEQALAGIMGVPTAHTPGTTPMNQPAEQPQPRPLTTADLGMTPEEAALVRAQLQSFAADWDAPGMEAYDEL